MKRSNHQMPNSNSNTSKPKKAFIQTNTLFSYFDSTKPKVESKPTNTITNYFIKPEKSTQEIIPAIEEEEGEGEGEGEEIQAIEQPNTSQTNSNQNSTQQGLNDFKIQKKLLTQSSLSKLMKPEVKKQLKPQLSLASFNREPKFNAKFKPDNNIKAPGSQSPRATNSRKCPFYKRIEATQITVDAFSYGDIDNCNVYFLSHYHYDHFIGLKKDFKNQMCCSKITANLVMKNIKVDKQYIKIFDMNKFFDVYENDSSIQVALIDANHCPGAVLFLFKLNKLRKYILHTGDFRASDELVNNAIFETISVDLIYLDTTYLDHYYTFLPQSKIIALGVQVARNELRAKPNTLIVCGTYTIGKERLFIAIAEAFNSKVYVTREKKNVIDCLEDERLSGMITQDAKQTNLHVIQMGKLNIKDLEEHAANFSNYDNIIAFKPSGWTHNASTQNGLSIEKKSKNITIYGLEYSEHSSFEELKNFITKLKPRKVIPTVNCGNKEKRDKMTAYLNEWQNCQLK